MDTVRFGRVLGQGARQAAKTLVSAVDAATAPNPATRPSTPHPSTPACAPSPSNTATPAQPQPVATPRPAQPTATILPPAPQRPTSASQTGRQAASTTRGLAEGTRRFGRAVWTPAVRLSGVLWLELTGVFFGLFALVAGIAAWRLHTALFAASASLAVVPASATASASDDRTRFFFAAGMVAVFGYFSLSSFLKANRRSRRP